MKIKLAILAKDKNYLSKMTSVFANRYSDKIEVYSYTDISAVEKLSDIKADVFLADSVFEINMERIPNHCGFAYLVDSPDIDSINDNIAICKFQKSDQLYKQILSVYSEKAGNIMRVKLNNSACKIIAFGSVSGGTGSSTAAVACAMHFAARKHKTLYLNLEKTGSSDIYFSGQGQFDMSDIIFALKSRKANLPLKLESCVRQDECGVYYFASPKIALDMMELSDDDIMRLINTLRLGGTYDYIIVDTDFGMERSRLEILGLMHSIILVCDGSEVCNLKTMRALSSLEVLDQNSDNPLMGRIQVLYNRFGKNAKTIENLPVKSIGGISKYVYSNIGQIFKQIQDKELFDNVI